MRSIQKDLPCDRKTRHPDQYVARAAAMFTLQMEDTPGLQTLYVYRCPDCYGWHLTKRRQSNPELAVTAVDPLGRRNYAIS